MLTKANIRDKVRKWQEFNYLNRHGKEALTTAQKGQIVLDIMQDYASRTPQTEFPRPEIAGEQVGRRHEVLWGIKMERVESSFIHSIGYSKTDKVLKVVIRDTTKDDPAIYAYAFYNVSNTLWKRFQNAKDFGKFFNKNIKSKFDSIALV